MMSKRLMVSVAAIALIAGAGFANAQGTGGAGRESGSGASMHGGSSAGSATPGTSGTGGGAMQRDNAGPSGAGSDMKSEQSEQRSSTDTRGQRAGDEMKGQKSKSSENETKGTKEGRDRADSRNNMHPENREGMSNNNNPTAENREGRSNVTTGQAGAGAKLSADQRTKITTVIRNEHVTPVTNVNFAVSVGTRVPRDVQFRPLPAEVVTIYPEWRGYNFILVHEQIVVVDPGTYEIVAVLDA